MRKITKISKFAHDRKALKAPNAARPKKLVSAAKNKSWTSPARKPAGRYFGRNGLPVTQLPPPGSGKRGESGYLGYLLRQAQAAARLTLKRALADLGITTPQFVVLTMLKAYPGLSGAELARVSVLTPQTVGVIIRNLERDRAIVKAAHPVHGRVLQWTLTRRGAARLALCRRHVMAVERRLASGLSTRNQAVVKRWLAGIAAKLAQ